jgi:DnaK suppressor protein
MSKRSAGKPPKAKAASAARAAPSRAVNAVKRSASAKTKTLAAKKAASAKKVSAEEVVVKQKVAGKKMTARAKSSSIVLPPDYRPSEDEPFMNERQRVYFRNKLLAWKDDIIRQTRETLAGLHEESTQHADLADRATSETDRALELRARDRQRKLIAKIDAALARIEDGSYGYCEETGEPIGLKRLDARPIATLSVEAQERHERRERVYRED